MFLKQFKSFIYIILFIFLLNLILPVTIFAFDEDSIYVWSTASSVSTSITPTSDEITNQYNSR